MDDGEQGAAGAWWEPFFDGAFADLVLERDAAREAAWLAERLAIGPGARVFDQCAGTGRVAIALAERGARVVGVEQSAEYVARARQDAARRGLAGECSFRQGDARAFAAPEPCDAALNWYTSFGFGDDARDDEALLGRAFASLRPGGRFALEYANVAHLLGAFREHMVQRRGGAMIVRESRLDLARGLLEQRWTYVLASGAVRERRGRTRLYMPHELAAMALRAGFDDVAFDGGPDARRPFGPSCPRCVLLARRPE